MKSSPSKPDDDDPAELNDDFDRPADEAPLTPAERTRLLAELEAEFEASERSVEEEGTISPEELKKHFDAKFAAWAREEEEERSATSRPEPKDRPVER